MTTDKKPPINDCFLLSAETLAVLKNSSIIKLARMDAKDRAELEKLPVEGNRKPLFSNKFREEILPPSSSSEYNPNQQ